jgi:hypothetical protein
LLGLSLGLLGGLLLGCLLGCLLLGRRGCLSLGCLPLRLLPLRTLSGLLRPLLLELPRLLRPLLLLGLLPFLLPARLLRPLLLLGLLPFHTLLFLLLPLQLLGLLLFLLTLGLLLALLLLTLLPHLPLLLLLLALLLLSLLPLLSPLFLFLPLSLLCFLLGFLLLLLLALRSERQPGGAGQRYRSDHRAERHAIDQWNLHESSLAGALSPDETGLTRPNPIVLQEMRLPVPSCPESELRGTASGRRRARGVRAVGGFQTPNLFALCRELAGRGSRPC